MNNFRLFFTLVVITFFKFSIQGQTVNQLVSEDVFTYSFENINLTDEGYFLSTPTKLFSQPNQPNFKNPYASIIDQNGELVWYLKSSNRNVIDFKYYEEEEIYSYVYNDFSGLATKILDKNLNPIDTLYVQNATQDVHDIQLADNGNWLITTAYFDTTDLSHHSFDGVQGNDTTVLVGYGVQEIDPSGNLVFEWNSNDHIDPTEFYNFYTYKDFDFDYCHGNAIEEDTDGHLLFSFRHLNAIYKVNRNSGSVIWKLGGKSSDFTFVNDTGFSAQHDIRVLNNGNYSLFDNGNMQNSPNTTRGIEYKLDTNNWTATLVDEVKYPTQLYARAMGSFQRLANLDVLGYGLIYRPLPTFAVFDKAKNVIAELHFSDSVVSYRTKFYQPTSFIRQSISCEENGSNWVLKGPDNQSEYKWSTGDTTSFIVIDSIGKYQVWTPQGDGFIGSEIFEVSNLTNPCNVNSQFEVNTIQNEKYYLVDVLGRLTHQPTPNKVYIKVYESGRTEKVFIDNKYFESNR